MSLASEEATEIVTLSEMPRDIKKLEWKQDVYSDSTCVQVQVPFTAASTISSFWGQRKRKDSTS